MAGRYKARSKPRQPGGWNEGEMGPRPVPPKPQRLRLLFVAGDGGRDLLVTEILRELKRITRGWRPSAVIVPSGTGVLEQTAAGWAEGEGVPVMVSTPPLRPESEQADAWRVWAGHWLLAADARVLLHPSGRAPDGLPSAYRRGWHRAAIALEERAAQLGVKVRRVG